MCNIYYISCEVIINFEHLFILPTDRIKYGIPSHVRILKR